MLAATARPLCALQGGLSGKRGSMLLFKLKQTQIVLLHRVRDLRHVSRTRWYGSTVVFTANRTSAEPLEALIAKKTRKGRGVLRLARSHFVRSVQGYGKI